MGSPGDWAGPSDRDGINWQGLDGRKRYCVCELGGDPVVPQRLYGRAQRTRSSRTLLNLGPYKPLTSTAEPVT
jgi:hypothetical protein